MNGEGNVKAIQLYVAVITLIDVPGNQGSAIPFRGRTQKDAGTSCFAVARFEIVAR
jgi:hypothetical protein